MVDIFRRDSCSFRYWNLSPALAEEIVGIFPLADRRAVRGNPEKRVVVIPLLDYRSNASEQIQDIIRKHSIDSKDYDMFFSVVVEAKEWSIVVAPWIINLFCVVGGDLLFSYTAV